MTEKFAKNLATAFIGQDDDDAYENQSQSSIGASTKLDDADDDRIDYDDLFGNPEVKTKSNDVSRGRFYLIFTIVMIVFLSILVLINTNQTVKDAYDSAVTKSKDALKDLEKTAKA